MEPEKSSGRVFDMHRAATVARDDGEPRDLVQEPFTVDLEIAAHDEFAAFYAEHRDRVARALALTLRDGHLAAEAVDEAMARAYQRWTSVRLFSEPAGWVYRVAINWATSVLRRRHRPVRALHDRPGEIGAVAEPAVAAALAELDVQQRAVVVCRFYLGMSEAETATALRIRPGTAKSRLHRALRALEVRLDHLRPEDHA